MPAVERPDVEDPRDTPIFEFSGLRVDTRRRELTRHGKSIGLYPRAFDALVFLVTHRRAVVTKARLLDALWPGLAVEENSVARVISDLRKALGPAAGSIATVQGLGYRFDAAVHALPRSVQRSSEPAKRILAILPFSSVGEDHEQLGFGLADALITRLSRLRNVVVRPTSSVVRFAAANVTPAEAGTALRADLVLCGSLRRHDQMIRISVQLIDVENEASVWAEQFDESMSDVFAMEDAIATRVTPLLVSELARPETVLALRGTDNADAYVLAQRGRYWLTRRQAPESASQAVQCFEAAIALDSRFAAAHAGLANAYIAGAIAAFTTWVQPPRTMIPLARAAAEQALRLVPDLGEAHGVLAHIAFGYDWNWPAAKAAFRHALQLDPRNVLCRQSFAIGLCCAGEFDAALHQLELAREFDPGSMLVRTNVGFVFHSWRRPDQAIAELEACLALEPAFAYARYRYGLALEASGRHEDALAQFERLRNTPGAEVQGLAGSACGFARTGRVADANACVAELLLLSERRYVSAYFLAEIFASLGDVAEAIAWLEKAYEERAMIMPSLRNNPRFDSLRSDPRFTSLEGHVGFWSGRDA
jgi:serine/threonine-protein kinase